MFFYYYPIEGAIYTWSKLEEDIDGKAFVDFCRQEGINRIAYYIETIHNSNKDFTTLAHFVGLARLHGIYLEALYDTSTDLVELQNFNNFINGTTNQWRCDFIQKLLYEAGYNNIPTDCNHVLNQYDGLFQFDAVRVDYETFWEWDQQNDDWIEQIEPTQIDHLEKYYHQVKINAGSLPVYASVGWHWYNYISFNGATKTALAHIMDITDGIDVQVAWAEPNGAPEDIERVEEPKGNGTINTIDHANAHGKKFWVTLYTNKTYYNTSFVEDGELVMKNNIKAISEGLHNKGYTFNGFMIVSYLNFYGKGTQLWPQH